MIYISLWVMYVWKCNKQPINWELQQTKIHLGIRLSEKHQIGFVVIEQIIYGFFRPNCLGYLFNIKVKERISFPLLSDHSCERRFSTEGQTNFFLRNSWWKKFLWAYNFLLKFDRLASFKLFFLDVDQLIPTKHICLTSAYFYIFKVFFCIAVFIYKINETRHRYLYFETE